MATAKIVFSDFDGTICLSDTTVLIIDACIGSEKRKALDEQVLRGEISFREAVGWMWDQVRMTEEQAKDLIADAKVDPGFVAFAQYCRANHIPIIVISSGLTWIVASCLRKFLGDDGMAAIHSIVANTSEVDAEGKWHITWVDETSFGHDKARTIAKALPALTSGAAPGQSKTYYIGDGISDISAGKTCDVLFAKAGKDLATWCIKEAQPYIAWHDFKDVQNQVSQS